MAQSAFKRLQITENVWEFQNIMMLVKMTMMMAIIKLDALSQCCNNENYDEINGMAV